MFYGVDDWKIVKQKQQFVLREELYKLNSFAYNRKLIMNIRKFQQKFKI